MLSRLLPRVTWIPFGSFTGGDTGDKGEFLDEAKFPVVIEGGVCLLKPSSSRRIGEKGGVLLRLRSRSLNDISEGGLVMEECQLWRRRIWLVGPAFKREEEWGGG